MTRRNGEPVRDRVDQVMDLTGVDREDVLDVIAAIDELGLAQVRGRDSEAIPSDWMRKASDLLKRPDPGPTPFAVDGLVVKGSICVVQGRHKVGKTWLVLELIFAMAGVRPAFGLFEAPEPMKVLGVFEESGEVALSRRLRALCRGYGIKRPSKALSLFRYAANARVQLLDPAWQDELIKRVNTAGIEVVVLDPLARMKGDAEENSQKEMAPLLDFLRRLREETGTTVILVHHTGHEGTHLRGTSDLEGYWESKITIKGEPTSAGPFRLTADHREAEKTEQRVSYRVVGNPNEQWVRLEADAEAVPRAERDRDDIHAYIEAQPGQTTREITEGVSRKRTAVQAALEALEREGLIARRDAGKRKEWHALQPASPSAPNPLIADDPSGQLGTGPKSDGAVRGSYASDAGLARVGIGDSTAPNPSGHLGADRPDDSTAPTAPAFSSRGQGAVRGPQRSRRKRS